MNSTIIVLYYGGFHGEFFIGNIVTNTNKFQYDYFKCRSKMLNAYQYEVIKSFDAAKIPIPGDIKTKNKNWTSLSQVELTNMSWSTRLNMMHYYSLVNKPVIFRAHKFNFLFTLPLVKLYTEDLMHIKRGVLLQCIKSLDKSYSNINGVPKSPPNNFYTPPKKGNHTTDSILHVDIKEWLHNKNLEKIEDFFQVEYTQTMKDAVTQYYERDNVLLDKYFPNWQNQSDEHLIEEMAQIDKEYGFFS